MNAKNDTQSIAYLVQSTRLAVHVLMKSQVSSSLVVSVSVRWCKLLSQLRIKVLVVALGQMINFGGAAAAAAACSSSSLLRRLATPGGAKKAETLHMHAITCPTPA